MSHSIPGQFGRRLQVIISLVRIRKQGLVWFFLSVVGPCQRHKRMMRKRMGMLSVVRSLL